MGGAKLHAAYGKRWPIRGICPECRTVLDIGVPRKASATAALHRSCDRKMVYCVTWAGKFHAIIKHQDDQRVSRSRTQEPLRRGLSTILQREASRHVGDGPIMTVKTAPRAGPPQRNISSSVKPQFECGPDTSVAVEASCGTRTEAATTSTRAADWRRVHRLPDWLRPYIKQQSPVQGELGEEFWGIGGCCRCLFLFGWWGCGFLRSARSRWPTRADNSGGSQFF